MTDTYQGIPIHAEPMPSNDELVAELERCCDRYSKMPHPRRYFLTLNSTAEKHLRRFSWPHKWRGPGRSMHHLRPVAAWLRSIESRINTPEVYAEIDRKLAAWIDAGYPPWPTDGNIPPELHGVRYVARISNL